MCWIIDGECRIKYDRLEVLNLNNWLGVLDNLLEVLNMMIESVPTSIITFLIDS